MKIGQYIYIILIKLFHAAIVAFTIGFPFILYFYNMT